MPKRDDLLNALMDEVFVEVDSAPHVDECMRELDALITGLRLHPELDFDLRTHIFTYSAHAIQGAFLLGWKWRANPDAMLGLEECKGATDEHTG